MSNRSSAAEQHHCTFLSVFLNFLWSNKCSTFLQGYEQMQGLREMRGGCSNTRVWCLGLLMLNHLDTAEMKPLTWERQAANPMHAKRDSRYALDYPPNQVALLPRAAWSQMPSLLFLQGQPWFWGHPQSLYALAKPPVLSGTSVGSTREAEKVLQTSKWPSSNSWEIGAATKIKHTQRFGEESHSFDSWQAESRGDCNTERKMTCKFPIKKNPSERT